MRTFIFIKEWVENIGIFRIILLLLALLVKILLCVFNPPYFISKQPLVCPFPTLLFLEGISLLASSLIIVEAIRVLMFYRTRTWTLKKHFAFVFAIFLLAGTIELAAVPKTAVRYYNYGWSLMESQNYLKASHSFDIAISYRPRYVRAYIERANAHRRLGNYLQAVADCDKAIEIAPNNFFAYASRGQSYYYLREYDQAINDFNKAKSLDRDQKLTAMLDKWIEGVKTKERVVKGKDTGP